MSASCPYDVKPLSQEELEQVEKCHSVDEMYHRFIRVGPKGYVMPYSFLRHAEGIYNFQLRPEDVFVTSLPRAGSTWTSELVWLIANNLDFETAKTIPLSKRFPLLDLCMLLPPPAYGENKYGKDPVAKKIWDEYSKPAAEVLETIPGQRFIKTHIPLSLLPHGLLDTCKMIYVARDIRDVAVSYFYFLKSFKFSSITTNDFKTFYEESFSKSTSKYSPYFEHIKEAWEIRNHPNMLFLFYEDLSKDLMSVARRVADFLGKQCTEQQLTQLCDYLKFENFKNNNAEISNLGTKTEEVWNDTNAFIRKGKVGGWREHFDEEMTRHAENWINKELARTGISYPQ